MKKIKYIILLIVLLFSFNVKAEKYTIPKTAPVGFNDKSHPYGDTDSKESFVFNKDDMILSYSYSQNKNEKSELRYYDLDNKLNTSKNILDSGKTLSKNNILSKLNFVQTVTFGPSNCLLDDYIAYLGVDTDKNLMLIVTNGKGELLKTATMGPYSLTWINDSAEYYQMFNMFSITSGDYNNDGKDTIVVAYSHTHNVYLLEYEYDVKNNLLTKINETDKLFNEEFLNTKTSNSNPYNLFEEDNKGKYGSNKLSIELKTGDLNNDSYDDLVVVSYANFCNNYDNYDYRVFTPYVAVSIGKSKFKLEKTNGTYANNSNLRTVLGSGFDLVDTNNDKKDEIIIAGGLTTYTIRNNKLTSYSKATKYGIMKIELVNSNLNKELISTTIDLDHYTLKNMSYENDRVYSRTSVLGTHLQGGFEKEQVFINGNIYTIDGNKVTKETNFTALDKESGRSVGIYQAVSGNYSNDSYRKETVRFITALKENGEDDYNIYYTELKYVNNETISYTDSYKFIDNKGDNLNECLSAVLISGDFNEDSLVLQYNKKDYRYSDMDILVILQATPYFEEIEDYYNNFGGTTYSISKEVNMSNSEGNNVAYSASIYTSVSAGSAVLKAEVSISEGYSLSWNKTFTTTHSYEIEESWTATTDDTVVIYYTPIISYYYNAYDVKTNSWVPNGYVVSIESNPVYEQKTVEQYNSLVVSYNKELYDKKKEKYDELRISEINLDESHLGVSGNLHKYPIIGGQGIKTYGETIKKASSSDALSATTYSSGVEKGFTTEMGHGFNFGLSVGVSAGIESTGNSVEVGVETNLEYMRTKSVEESTKNTVEIEANVGNYRGSSLISDGYSQEQSEAYTFEWQLAVWDSNISMNGVPIKVVGYAVQNITELPGKVQNLVVKTDIDEDKNIINGINLSWSKSNLYDPLAENVYIVYVEEKGEWLELIRTKDTSYTYKRNDGYKNDTYTFRVINAIEYFDSNNKPAILASLDSIETAYVHIDGFTIYEFKKVKSKEDKDGRIIDIYEFVLSNGKTINFEVINGKDGKNGIDGKDGKDALTPELRINKDTNMWEVSYDGKTWTSLGFSASGNDGKNGKNGITPQLRFNNEANSFEVSYDNGKTWETLMEMSKLYGDTQQAVTPLMRINPDTNEWEISYNNGLTYTSLNVKATGENGKDGTTTIIEVAAASVVATGGVVTGAFYIFKKKALSLISK